MLSRSGKIFHVEEIRKQHHRLAGNMVRVVGKIKAFDPHEGFVVISSEAWDLKINIKRLGPTAFKCGSLFQFVGELEQIQEKITPIKNDDRGLILNANVCRCVDGMDMTLYSQALDIKRKFTS
eukprot:Nk52_evm1s2122 gene=Nk52_evmTU1s2122